jgi:hypothetical protein
MFRYPLIKLQHSITIILALFLLLALYPVPGAARVQGGLVLAFDDGYRSWITTIAPELARVKGVASGFVNIVRIRPDNLTFEDLRTLQDHYGWEIGTHLFHHYNALEFLKRQSMSAWVRNELDASASVLRSQGIKVRSMVFPHNVFSPELCREVRKRFETFRDPKLFFVSAEVREDGSIPGRIIDITQFVPLELIFKWIDLAQERGVLLFLYGHQVLPDAEFQTGEVAAVSQRTLTATENLRASSSADLFLVPDTSRRFSGSPIRVVRVEGNKIQAGRGDLTRLTKPGAKFMIGPGYATRLSDFRALLDYAAPRVKFYTVHQVATGQWRQNR